MGPTVQSGCERPTLRWASAAPHGALQCSRSPAKKRALRGKASRFPTGAAAERLKGAGNGENWSAAGAAAVSALAPQADEDADDRAGGSKPEAMARAVRDELAEQLRDMVEDLDSPIDR